jgi:hypothetical protein
MRTAQVTKLRFSNKENNMKTAQSIHAEINLKIEFNTLNGTPKGSDHLGGVKLDAKKNGKIYF